MADIQSLTAEIRRR